MSNPLHVSQAVSVAVHGPSSTAMQDDFGLVCQCGAENFERVVVHRQGQPDYVTAFVACVLCKVMFHLPVECVAAEFNYDKAFPPGSREWRR